MAENICSVIVVDTLKSWQVAQMHSITQLLYSNTKQFQNCNLSQIFQHAVIAQLGERQTEDLKVPGSIPGRGIIFCSYIDIF